MPIFEDEFLEVLAYGGSDHQMSQPVRDKFSSLIGCDDRVIAKKILEEIKGSYHLDQISKFVLTVVNSMIIKVDENNE